jgi:hypothetical protein
VVLCAPVPAACSLLRRGRVVQRSTVNCRRNVASRLNVSLQAPTNHEVWTSAIESMTMKVAMLALLGLMLGVLGGGAMGLGAGIAWSEWLYAAQDSAGNLVFFTFLPIGAMAGGVGGAILFGVIAARDAEIRIEDPAIQRDLMS